MHILICGDSWAADWSVKYNDLGWPNILQQHHDVTNIAQAGVSQYRICQQLQDIDITKFDVAVCSITSPNRIYSNNNTAHIDDALHSNCDLMFADLEHAWEQGNKTPQTKSALDFFMYHWDKDHADFVHQLLVDWCFNKLNVIPTIGTSNIINNNSFATQWNYVCGVDICANNKGIINHMNEQGNKLFADMMLDKISTCRN